MYNEGSRRSCCNLISFRCHKQDGQHYVISPLKKYKLVTTGVSLTQKTDMKCWPGDLTSLACQHETWMILLVIKYDTEVFQYYD